jgi:hypothetical protein
LRPVVEGTRASADATVTANGAARLSRWGFTVAALSPPPTLLIIVADAG